jgi:hypothetical protein
MYAAAQCEITITNPYNGKTSTSDRYDWNRGIWQGGVASPTLYILLLNYLLIDADPDPHRELWDIPAEDVNRCEYCLVAAA